MAKHCTKMLLYMGKNMANRDQKSLKLQQCVYYIEILLNAALKKVSLSIPLSHCTTHIAYTTGTLCVTGKVRSGLG